MTENSPHDSRKAQELQNDTNQAQPAKTEKSKSLLAKSLVVSGMTFISRILGLIRDIVIASFIGAGGAADAFLVAFKIPNFLRRLFAEGAFNQAFVPLLSEYATTKSEAVLKRFIAVVSGNLIFILTIITILGVLGAPVLTWIFAPGFHADAEKFQFTTDFLRITFPYIWFISLVALSSSILNVRNSFAVPAFTPTLLNISLICMAVLLSPSLNTPAMALAIGVFVAGLAQLLFQMPFLARQKLLVMPKMDWQDAGVKRLLKLMLPAIFGVSVSQINLLLDTVLASLLPNGSVSWLYYSDRLVELPLGIFAIAIATVVLPRLSKTNATNNKADFTESLNWGMRSVLLIALPAMAGLILLADALLISLFQYGAMTAQDVFMSSQSLIAYSCGLLPLMMIKVLATGYFSRQDTKTPVKIGIYAMLANMLFNLILVFPLAHAGLALATSLAGWLNAGLLFWGLKKAELIKFDLASVKFVFKIIFATLLMAVVLYYQTPDRDFWLVNNYLHRWLNLLYLVGLGALVYFLSLRALGIRIKDFLKK